MKLKVEVASVLVQAALGRPLAREHRKCLAALALWIMDGCPERPDPGVWADDDTLPIVVVS